jgi:hypothetical protein
MGKALYIQSVEQAADIAGGYDQLAAVLGVTRYEVDSWVSGSSTPGTAIFLRLIDIALSDPQSRPSSP